MANYNDSFAFISLSSASRILSYHFFQRSVGTVMTPSSKCTPTISCSVSSEVTFILPALQYNFIFHINFLICCEPVSIKVANKYKRKPKIILNMQQLGIIYTRMQLWTPSLGNSRILGKDYHYLRQPLIIVLYGLFTRRQVFLTRTSLTLDSLR